MKTKKRGLKSVRTLTTAAMLTGLSIIIGIFCKNFLNFGNGLFRISFENFAIILSGILFGPIVGALVGAAADVLSYVLSTQSLAITPIVTLGAALIGAVSGVVSHYIVKKDGVWRIILSALSAHVVGSMIVKSFGLYVYYGWAVLYRIPLYVAIAAVEIALMCFIFKKTAYKSLFFGSGGSK